MLRQPVKKHFSDNTNTVILNVYDYQQAAYKEAGFDDYIPFGQEFRYLYRANENLLADIVHILQNGKSVVVEQTFYKAKRRQDPENVDIVTDYSEYSQQEINMVSGIKRAAMFVQSHRRPMTSAELRENSNEIKK